MELKTVKLGIVGGYFHVYYSDSKNKLQGIDYSYKFKNFDYKTEHMFLDSLINYKDDNRHGISKRFEQYEDTVELRRIFFFRNDFRFGEIIDYPIWN